MKSDKLKELYSEIDIDTVMDHRIKNQLLYYDTMKEDEFRSRYGDPYGRKTKSFRTKLTVMKPVLPSLAVLLCIAVVLVGIRANLFHNSDTKGNKVETSSGQAADTSQAPVDAPSIAMEEQTEGNESILESFLKDIVVEQDTQTELPVVTDDINVPEKSVSESITEEQVNTDVPLNISELEAANSTSQPEEKTKTIDKKTEKAVEAAGTGDFYFAWFEVISDGNIKSSIPSLVIRLHGFVETIDPNDLTNIVLSRDGIPVENSITYSGERVPFTWSYEEVTDFYFNFTTNNTTPGSYSLNGNYKGIPFTVYNKIIEAAITEDPANPEELSSVSWCYFPDENNKPKTISEIGFHFNGQQNAFYPSDLTELKLTLNNVEIPFSFQETVFRYYEAGYEGGADTSFNLLLTEDLTASGTYILTGKYMGKSFKSMDIIIP